MDLIPVIVFAFSVVLLLVASSIPPKMRAIENLDEYKELAERKGLSLDEIDPRMRPLTVPDRSAQITTEVIVTLLILGASVFIILSKEFDAKDKHWAYGSAGAVLGYWLN